MLNTKKKESVLAKTQIEPVAGCRRLLTSYIETMYTRNTVATEWVKIVSLNHMKITLSFLAKKKLGPV